MGIDRVSSYGVFLKTLNDVTKLDSTLADLQGQLSSGYKSSTFDGIADSATQFLNLETKLSQTDQFLKNNSVMKTRVNATTNALTQIIDSATQLKNLILQRRSESNNVGAFGTQIEASWKAIAGQLNLSLDGRYLFSGGRTNSKAVNDQDFPVLADNNETDTGYYLGDTQDQTAYITDNVQITTNIRADEAGFQKIFAGLSLAKQGDAAHSDQLLARAYDMVDEGIRNVITLQAQANSNLIAIDNANDTMNTQKTYFQGIKEEIGNTDIIAVSTQVAVTQSILQATFQAFARISSLRLSDFLR